MNGRHDVTIIGGNVWQRTRQQSTRSQLKAALASRSISWEGKSMRGEEVLLKTSEDEKAIHEVVSQYYAAFVRDPEVAARYYGEPSLVVLQDQVTSLPTRADVAGFLTKARDALKARGYLTTEMDASRAKRLSNATALYATVAIRLKTDGTELERAAFTYLLHQGDTGWKIHALIATDSDGLVG
jgi:hypothetical protein